MPIRYSEKVEIGDREFFAAPLSCETLEDEGPKFDRLVSGGWTGVEGLGIAVDIIFASLVRNHPDLTREELRRHVDCRNIGDAVEAVLRASGLEKGKTAGEAGSP